MSRDIDANSAIPTNSASLLIFVHLTQLYRTFHEFWLSLSSSYICVIYSLPEGERIKCVTLAFYQGSRYRVRLPHCIHENPSPFGEGRCFESKMGCLRDSCISDEETISCKRRCKFSGEQLYFYITDRICSFHYSLHPLGYLGFKTIQTD